MTHRIALNHVATIKAGQVGYTFGRERGHLDIWHDSKRYSYDITGLGVTGKEARSFIRDAWSGALDNGAKITGRFPSYTID